MSEVPYYEKSQKLRIIWIDESSGRVRPEEVSVERAGEQTYYGTAQQVRLLSGRREWFALTNDESGVLLFRDGYFQPLYEPACTGEVRDFGVVSRFRLVAADQEMMSFWYFNPYSRPSRLVDCMYAEMERMMDDILFTIGHSLNEGQWGSGDEEVAGWRDGF